MPDIKEKCPIVMRIINLGSALILIGFGIAGIVVMTMNELSGGKFFLLFSPILMIVVGLLFVVAQFQIECIMKHFTFMKSYFGRGVFNVFMASAVFYYFACGNDNIAVAWISAILIFCLGIFYIIIGLFCSSFGEEKQTKEELVS